jgi:F0F1-type ATP synthase membrane subunit a
MIKVVNLVSLIIAPLVVTAEYRRIQTGQPAYVLIVAMVVLIGVIVWSIQRSKRHSGGTDEIYASASASAD